MLADPGLDAVVIATADIFHVPAATAALIPRANLVEITAKADSRERYCDDLRQALAAFLKGYRGMPEASFAARRARSQ
jgi:hypothetical protein